MTEHEYIQLVESKIDDWRGIRRGLDRTVYLFPDSGFVIKVAPADDEQTRRELRIYDKMTLEEARVFPLIHYFYHEDKIYIVMEYCPSLMETHNARFSGDTYTAYDEVCDKYNLNDNNSLLIEHVIYEYNIGDLHSGNLGVDKNNELVILDMGMSGEYSYYSALNFTC